MFLLWASNTKTRYNYINMHWFDLNLGQYDLAERWVGLDYKELFLDPILADITYAHEVSHGVMALQSDFGQATNVIFKLQDSFTKIQSDEVDLILKSLFQSQDKVQEGFATFMEISRLRALTTKQNALAWAQQNLPPAYKQYLAPLLFGFELSKGYREFFTAKVSWLAMETGIRKTLHEQDLLSDPSKLATYLSDEDNNPNVRLLKICDTLRIKSWLVTKDNPTLAKECGVKYHEPATKAEVAEFLNYTTGFTDNPQHFSPEQIGDTPQGADAFIQVSKNMIVANLNLKLAETAKVMFNLNDFLNIAPDIEIIFVNPHDKDWKHHDLVKLVSGEEPEVAIGGFKTDDQKYLTVTSREKASEVINNDLRHATLFVKWGGYDLIKNQLIWSETVRPPDLVVYNTIDQLQDRIKQVFAATPDVQFQHLHLGASEGHPFQSLLLKIGDLSPLHIVNCFGNKGISETIRFMGNKTKVITHDGLKTQKQHINNLMCLWMGMPWKVDWVETMINGKKIVFREERNSA